MQITVFIFRENIIKASPMFRAKLCVHSLPNSGKTKMTLLKSDDGLFITEIKVQN